jgi:hypothetical protein
MSYQIIHKSDLIFERWDDLVINNPSSTVFSLSSYIDALTTQWAVIVNDDFTGGMLLPYKIKWGVKTLFTPSFMRYSEWIGDLPSDFNEILDKLRNEFDIAAINLRNPMFEGKKDVFCHQVLSAADFKLNQLAKRMLKKIPQALTLEMIDVASMKNQVLDIVEHEIAHKKNAWKKESYDLLNKLILNLDKESCISLLGAKINNEIVGGLFLMQFHQRIIFLKGSVVMKYKEQGVMYALMKKAIESAHENDFIFDFGGSNVEGVQRFNCNFGAKNEHYYFYQWNHAKYWYKSLKTINKWLKK